MEDEPGTFSRTINIPRTARFVLVRLRARPMFSAQRSAMGETKIRLTQG